MHSQSLPHTHILFFCIFFCYFFPNCIFHPMDRKIAFSNNTKTQVVEKYGHPKRGQFFHIFFVAVHSGCQRSGILKGLVTQTESLAKRKGYEMIVVEAASPPTLRYFPQIGYEVVTKAMFSEWKCPLHKDACEGFQWAVTPDHDHLALVVKSTADVSAS